MVPLVLGAWSPDQRRARHGQGPTRRLGPLHRRAVTTVGSDRFIPIPPKLGADLSPEYLLRPDDVALFEWGYGHTLGEWADAQENPRPANPNGACFLTVTVTDWLSSGVVDHYYVLLQARPIARVPGMQGQWKPLDSPKGAVGLVVFPPQRTYRAYQQAGAFAPPPWQDLFAEWNAQHSPPSHDQG